MCKPSLYVALAIGATLPGFCLRLPGTHVAAVLEAVMIFGAVLGAGFLLSWGGEAAGNSAKVIATGQEGSPWFLLNASRRAFAERLKFSSDLVGGEGHLLSAVPGIAITGWRVVPFMGFLFFVPFTLRAQSSSPNSTNNLLWTEASVEGKIGRKFYYDLDFQYRRQADASNVPGGSRYNLLKHPSEMVLRPFITYKVDSSLSLALSPLGWYGKWEPVANQGLFFTPELRLVPQIIYKHPLGPLRLEHRGRYEFRWGGEKHLVPDGSDLDEGYSFADTNKKGRIRYRLKAALPLSQNRPATPKIAVSAYNELFVSVGKYVPLADRWNQNRAFLGLDYTLRSDITLEAGYINQVLFQGQSNGQRVNHILSLSIQANDLNRFFKHNP